mgnify:CR=1 FL=1
MVNIIYLICIALIGFSVGGFMTFVISKLRKIDSQTDSISKHHWSMGIYMNDIPQNKQNSLCVSSIPLKLYDWEEYLDLPVPRVGEEISGVYGYENRFEMKGIVNKVYYNTAIDWIVVECKCTDIQKLK